jgi:hypothetical protein
MWGPVSVDGRSQFPIYADLGVGIWQGRLSWDQIAGTRPANARDPSDPAYVWPPEIDEAIAEARRYKMKVCLQLMYSPGWANGGFPRNWGPTRTSDFADFAEAAAQRYPTVRLWMVWGEPSRQPNFMPLVPETVGKITLTRAQAAAPRRYAQLLDASYSALKSVRRSNLVIGGNTFTVGDISPYNWIRYLKLPNGRRPRMDLFGHNPFTQRGPDLKKPPPGKGNNAVNYSDFSDLDTFAFVLDYYKVHDAKGRKLRLFLSEFTIPTDHFNLEFPFYVSRRLQARWVTAALEIVRRWSRIYTLGWVGLYDDPPRVDHREVNRGLIDVKGRRKPGYYAFKRG